MQSIRPFCVLDSSTLKRSRPFPLRVRTLFPQHFSCPIGTDWCSLLSRSLRSLGQHFPFPVSSLRLTCLLSASASRSLLRALSFVVCAPCGLVVSGGDRLNE
jgi:hypothetical protein